MSMLVNIVMADECDIEAIGESARPIDDWKGLAVMGLDAAKFAMLHSILTGETFEEASGHYEPIWAASDEGPWVIRLPAEPMEKLAGLEDEVLEQLGEELAATEDFEADGWPVEETQAVLAELAALAEAASAKGQSLFVWMTPASSATA